MKFDPRKSNEDGIVAVGGRIEPKLLLQAYRSGVFPWPQEDMPLLWFSPDPRGVLDFSEFHVPQSLKKFINKNKHWKFTFNKAFKEVVENCRLQSRPNQNGTWILPEMVNAYFQLNQQGFALSCELLDGQDLIGGIYGVLVDGVFSGESMFYKKSNASKVCFLNLVEYLQILGHKWMDIQMVTEVTQTFGGKYISREEFLQRKKI